MAPDLRSDKTDDLILGSLSADGRRSFASIGLEVGLSTAAVKRRVDRLRRAGVITGFTVLIDQKRLGRPIEALVELHTDGVLGVDRLRRALGPIAEIVEAVTVTGDADTIVRLVAADTDRLEAAVQALRAIPSVRKTETNIVLSHLVTRSATAF
ncbi:MULTISPECIES: Lrp/AsnC family transcriptional regulator [unclassified Knoellia]|uniref:Lrp/AsnC family transcriptional regulator n=1 Tax=Knoellia altitudinis TaxID=3404795 RepID=UPI003607A02B